MIPIVLVYLFALDSLMQYGYIFPFCYYFSIVSFYKNSCL